VVDELSNDAALEVWFTSDDFEEARLWWLAHREAGADSDRLRWQREADQVRLYAESLPVQPWADDPRQQAATRYWLRRHETSSRVVTVAGGGRRGRFADPVAALGERLERVRWSGTDRFAARCPAHEDRSPSLAVARGRKGAVVHCHAGCRIEDVLSAISLSVGDLFPVGS